MKFRTTILLLIVLLGVGAYIFFSHPAAEQPEQAVPSPDVVGTKLLDLKSADVRHVVIKPASGAQIVLDRTGDNWTLVAPSTGAADTFAVNSLVGALTELRSTGQLSTDQKSAAGLDHPSYTVELTDQAGHVTSIAFGDKPPLGGALDVLVNGRDKLDVVATSILDQLSQPASTYRKTALVSVMADQIQQIWITPTGRPAIELTKQGDGWQMHVADQGHDHIGWTDAKADSTAVADITTALSGLSAKTFVDEQQPLSFFGLSEPALVVSFSTAAPSTQPVHAGPQSMPGATGILFGNPEDVSKENVYAAVGGQVVTIPATTEQTFTKSPLDLRDKMVLDISPDSVSSFTIDADRTGQQNHSPNFSPKYSITLERRDDLHVMGPVLPTTLPATGPAPTTKPASHWLLKSGMRGTDGHDEPVDALLAALHPLTVQKYVESAATTQPYSTYELTIHSTVAGTVALKITDPGGDQPLLATTGNVSFELDRAFLPKISAAF